MDVIKANPSSCIKHLKSKDIVTYYNEGHTIKECGLYFGVHEETIRYHMKKAGIGDLRHGKLRINIDELVAYYQDSHTISECALKYGCGDTAIYNRLKPLEIIRNDNPDYCTDDIIKYYNEGHTVKECAERFGIHPETIRVKFRKFGVPDCRYKEPKPIDDMLQIVDYYRSGRSLDECSDKFGVSVERLKTELELLGALRSKEEMAQISSDRTKKSWANDEIRHKMVANNVWDVGRKGKSRIATNELWKRDGFKEKVQNSMEKRWQDEQYRDEMLSKFADPENRRKISELSKISMADPKLRRKLSDRMKIQWRNGDYAHKMAIYRSLQPCMSSIQTILYGILDDLGVKYFREYSDKPADSETVIGPWSFDCAIPRNDSPTLLIECQGDYWHSHDHAVRMDLSKQTYIERYHSSSHELKYLWEHEFSEKSKIIETIKHWLGMSILELIEFSYGDVVIKECLADDYKPLLSKYHYLPNAGRGGMAHGAFGAYINDTLIAVCVFAPLIRQNLPYDYESTRELSRLCIHPRYQKKNFASWFVSRCLKTLDPKYKTIISYCDTTFNHDGAVYKACNFRLDGEVRPDYWYVNKDRWIMHKKTLYEHANKMGVKENDYADKYGYKRVYGKEKLRFIYER